MLVIGNSSAHIGRNVDSYADQIRNEVAKGNLRSSRVVQIQADGDELDAILWGLANFNKGKFNS